MRYTVHWKTSQSVGSSTVDANNKKEAENIISKRMPHGKVLGSKLGDP